MSWCSLPVPAQVPCHLLLSLTVKARESPTGWTQSLATAGAAGLRLPSELVLRMCFRAFPSSLGAQPLDGGVRRRLRL